MKQVLAPRIGVCPCKGEMFFILMMTAGMAGCEERGARPLNEANGESSGAVKEARESVQSEIAALAGEQAVRTPAQRKLDSQIVLALKKSRKEPPFDKTTSLKPGLLVQADGRVLVDLKARVSAGLLEQIEQSGGQVINSFDAARAIRALIPLTQAEVLAARDDVDFISPAAEATTNQTSSLPDPTGVSSSTKE